MTTTRYLSGVPCWVEVTAPDPAAAGDFYSAVFGWRVRDGRALLDGRPVAGVAEGEPGWSTAVAVPDADAAVARAVAAGATVTAAPAEADGARTAHLRDPDGAGFAVWQARDLPGAELVNQPGAWNFSNLTAPDPARAARFYGELFGWVADRVEGGGFDATMWRRPGYGDHLAVLDPSLRERHAAPGVPPGFSDAIGWLAEGAPAAWEVTFTVADADAVAAAATDRGAVAVVEPYSVGPSRLATLRDPWGAAFTVSAYAP